jgi:hypothetical protein
MKVLDETVRVSLICLLVEQRLELAPRDQMNQFRSLWATPSGTSV